MRNSEARKRLESGGPAMTPTNGEEVQPSMEWCADDLGYPRCALPIIEYPAPGERSVRDCGAEMYVEWSFTVPITPGESSDPDDVVNEAVSSGWRLTCTNGHVLRVSSNGFSATDYAEVCDFDRLFGLESNGREVQP